MSEDDLIKRVTEIDLKDGKLDGQYTKPVVKCSSCGSAISHEFNKCLFCGKAFAPDSAF